ncbi:DUF2272 domain-containing protein [Roseomonas chloroacetimidivorans]|uniref:DUF2272 domain-containing protein n=1 Tax=Roseomonas chloroacetimidivorans TaxID=1766656 RepID=UPI003C7151FA
MSNASIEWQRWGSPTFDPNKNLVSRTGASPVLTESDPRAFSNVLAYWSIFSDKSDYIGRQREVLDGGRRGNEICTQAEKDSGDADLHLWGCVPWSAAFISYIMQTGGIDQREFSRGSAHVSYVNFLLREGQREPIFNAHEANDYTPQVGDLICADRTASPITTLAQHRSGGRNAATKTHCDLVMNVSYVPGRSDNAVYVIGGNVENTVACSIVPLNSDGRLVRTPKRSWFVIFQNRIPQLPSAAPTSNVRGCGTATGALVASLP